MRNHGSGIWAGLRSHCVAGCSGHHLNGTGSSASDVRRSAAAGSCLEKVEEQQDMMLRNAFIVFGYDKDEEVSK